MVTHFLFKNRDGQTPLPAELKKGLRLKHIQNMGELDEYEEENITEGLIWLAGYNGECAIYEFWLKLHLKLFGNVWSWAGKVRDHELSNSDFLMPYDIWPAFKKLEDDLIYWIEHKTYFDKEIAARFHERLLTIHPFANGNGRFSRIIVEYFCKRTNVVIPTWGALFTTDAQKRRKKYIQSIEEARTDKNVSSLIEFMFS